METFGGGAGEGVAGSDSVVMPRRARSASAIPDPLGASLRAPLSASGGGAASPLPAPKAKAKSQVKSKKAKQKKVSFLGTSLAALGKGAVT